MNDQPQTIYVTKSVLADGHVEKILAHQIPTTIDWIGASGRWKHIRIDSYYVFTTEEAAIKAAKASLKYQIESQRARADTLETFTVSVIDATDEPLPVQQQAAE